ncbi:MAG: pyridoxal-phosphate dependent enzyme [Rhodobacterales bacterium]|nr:pyridoxal-phosphate dependent enzyme [Rhodobacterales bacterium]
MAVLNRFSDLLDEITGWRRDLGAEVDLFDRNTQSSDDVVAALLAETGRINVPPSADRRVLSGGGTIAIEILEQREGAIDTVLVPCGGGGITGEKTDAASFSAALQSAKTKGK